MIHFLNWISDLIHKSSHLNSLNGTIAQSYDTYQQNEVAGSTAACHPSGKKEKDFIHYNES